jgi:cytosine/creatinine deaminase
MANFIILTESSVFEAICKRVNVVTSVHKVEFLFSLNELEYEVPLDL